MTVDMLIAEGKRLARRTVFLRPSENGEVAAMWYKRDEKEIERTGHHCWISVDERFIPFSESGLTRFLSVYTDETGYESGRVEEHTAFPDIPGTPLYATEESVLPPIEAIFMGGSAVVEDWLVANDWPRDERYNSNFPDLVAEEYQRYWSESYPLFRDDGTYAVLGGWHCPWADPDWYQLMREALLVYTLQDSEPWIEAWRLRDGNYKVIQRVT